MLINLFQLQLYQELRFHKKKKWNNKKKPFMAVISTGSSNDTNDADIVEEQIKVITSKNESEKFVLLRINGLILILPGQKCFKETNYSWINDIYYWLI